MKLITLEGWGASRQDFSEYAHNPPREVAPDVYQHFLEVLPPHRWETNGFLVGEPCDHTPRGTTYSAFIRRGGQERYYYMGELTVEEFYEALGLPEGGEE